MKAKLKIPTELNDISLKQYQEFLKAVEGVDNADLVRQRTIEHFCEIPLRNVMLIKMSEVKEICDDIDTMFQIDKPLYQTFKIKNVEFGMIPNLEEMTFGEYVDLDGYVSDWNNMHKAMAVLFRPVTTKIKDKYQIEEYESSERYSELMQFAPLGVVMGAMVFFYNLGNELSKAMQAYLKQEVEELILTQPNSSQKSGGGTDQSMHSLAEGLKDLMKLLDFPLESV